MVRDVFLSTVGVARKLITSPEVAARWTEASALDRMTIGTVAAHLARAALTVQQYLELPPPDAATEPITAAQYFADALPSDLDDEVHRGIRARSDQAASEGRDAVVRYLDDTIASVTVALASAPPDTRVTVFGKAAMLLDQYLVTRLVELVVHLDDLACSIGVATPAVEPEAVDVVTRCFVDIARIRHGDVAVIRALARRERAPVQVFPVF